ncbi:hypothetical protein CERZMDRAFT_51515 [Cercospora zeae-maydis SCOH1-5]|uniref:Uncharacterized protein n=1 Tax=Cercospora zeae-maydis SCOH1-5 TaxID=717836 RepID=A0A6A6F1D5_9PEZI|nr:hypothetical protein CERZMDRAFT_51515 [Cercospora zeae-maydis SCOH1-5]
MAEDDGKPSKASRFLKKSKWGKVLKEREPSEDDGPALPRQGTFTLNNDVVDFLKPSTEKSKPRLDIAIAKRWPEAHQVKALGEESPAPDRPTFTKPKRRKGLTVGFAKTQPEIIGEGGDEAPDPPREIGRRKAAMARSVSDARPGPRSPPTNASGHSREPSLQHAGEEEFLPPPVRRVNTSHNELSPPMSQKFSSPPSEDVQPHRPSIGRVPTGFDESEIQHTTPLETPITPQLEPAPSEHSDSTQPGPSDIPPPQQPPSVLDTRNYLADAMSDDATSPVVQKRREINRNEGMAFRRASMLIHRKSEEDDEDAASSNPRQSKASSATTQDMLVSPPSDYTQSPPESIVSPEAPNPFADPKYLERISAAVTLAQPPQAQSAIHQQRQTPQNSDLPVRSSAQSGISAPSTHADEGSNSPGLRDRLFNSSSSSQPAVSMFTKHNASSSSINHFSPRSSHSRPSSRDGASSLAKQSIDSVARRSQSPHSHNGPPTGGSPRASLLGPGKTGPSPGPSPLHRPHDYFAAPSIPAAPKSPAAALRQEESSRPQSTGSALSLGRHSASSQPSMENNPAAEAAFADFATRVAHMKGVFRLTAEKEMPADRCTPSLWLRAALWWYHTGKTGLETIFTRRDPNDHRELLTQPHVDLAKAWWIVTDPLEKYDASYTDERASEMESRIVRRGLAALKNSLKSLSLSISKNHLLPPEASLIQGQNTTIWVDYPRFTSDAAAILGGSVSKSVIVEESKHMFDPHELLPLNDTREFFWYGRFPVEVYLRTEDEETDRVVLPCLLTVLRGRLDYQTSLVIASQNDLVNIRILPRQATKRVLTWSDVSWQASSGGIAIHLPRNFVLSVRMQERDFRALWNLSEYARKVERTLHPEPDEKLVHESRLVELQYVDSTNSSSFPTDKIRGCSVLIFEHLSKHVDGSGARRVHRGFRMLLITEPGHKTLSAVNHDICRDSPFYFELLTDSAAGGTTAMVVRIREAKRQCRMLFVFPDAGTRQALYDVVNGLALGRDEAIVGKMSLASLNIEPAAQSLSFTQSAHPALQNIQWQKLGITNGMPDDDSGRPHKTVQSESLRILARHATGCITDRLNLGKGELLLRLPPVETPSVQILRDPQEDMTMSIDTKHSHPTVASGMAELLSLVREQQTVRTFTFQTLDDLHAFEAAITGCTVRFDGIAATLDISRRRMVVPIYKKWQAQNVRIQIVSQGQIVQLLAFMEEFSHADALCFQIKSTDVFEKHKGDSKGKKWTVKLVDAKFTLPKEKGKEEREDVYRKGRFVNLENLEYAEEHDDVTIGFETEQDRDRFAQALPAAASMSRGITLKRRV